MPDKIPLKDVPSKIFVCKECKSESAQVEKPPKATPFEIKKEKGTTFRVCKKCEKKVYTAN